MDQKKEVVAQNTASYKFIWSGRSFQRANVHATCGPKDLTEEDTSILVEPMFFHRPSMTSTDDSAESIATFLNRIWMMSKCGICWLHLLEREACADR